MKKNNLVIGMILLGGVLLLTGCGTDENDAKASTHEIGEGIENDQSIYVENAEVVENSEDEVDLTSWKVEHTEYTSLERFMTDTSKNWKEGSEYQEVNYSAESTIANATIAYVNYFKHEIEDMGLTEDFNEFQMIAYELVQSNEEGDYEELVKSYEEKMNNILSKM